MHRVPVLLLVLLSVMPARAQEKPTVLLLDASASTVNGARARVGFERFPIADEEPFWKDSTGHWDSTGVALLAGGGLLGAGFADAHAQSQRNRSIEALRSPVEQDKRLQLEVIDAIRAAAAAHGHAIGEVFVAPSVEAGHVKRAALPNGTAVVVQRDAAPLVMLSWDNRHILLSFDVRRYKRSEGVDRVVVREQSARKVRYVGYPAPSGIDAVEYWSADRARYFMGEVEAALAAMLPLAWGTELEMPSVPRKERARLRVGDRELEFPGRIVKQDDELAHVATADKAVTIVRIKPWAAR